jgi:hypothetical protein
MKTLKLFTTILFLLMSGFNLFSQNVRDNPPTQEELDGFTQAADMIGNHLKGDPCSGQSYAEQLYCYLGQLISDLLPCMYGPNTPQYTLCESSQSLNTATNSNEQQMLNELNNLDCFINVNVRPIFFETENGSKMLKEKFAKTEENEVVHRYKNGYSLSVKSKHAIKGAKYETFLRLKFSDANGKMIAAPVFLPLKNGYWLFEGCYK